MQTSDQDRPPVLTTPCEALAAANPGRDKTPAPEAASWLSNPTTNQGRAPGDSLACWMCQLLRQAERPDPEEEQP